MSEVGIPPSTSILLPAPSSSSYSYSRRPASFLPRLSGITSGTTFALPKPLSRDALLLGSGLTTPPVDDMSTTYQPPLAAYDSHAMHSYPSMMPHSSGRTSKAAAATDDRGQFYRYPSQQPQQQPQLQQQLQEQPHHHAAAPLQVQSNSLAPQAHTSQTHAQTQQLLSSSQSSKQSFNPTSQLLSSRHSTRPSTPATDPSIKSCLDGPASRRGSDALIYHSLQIPKCISPNGGNLADFAAQMTCLFWFESVDELKMAENIHTRSPTAPVPRLPALAKPYDQFRKWVYNVLSTTQVTQNVIFLALLFIYRLKMSTPQIKGRGGSEYRLLTVALMLGNKFLDDNTYTNKTWAEVSCFAVQEIHVMEVEFLSNMRYNLLASKGEWEGWLSKLACFHEYYDRALQLPVSPVPVPSPNNKASFHSPIPSPTATTLPSVPDMAPFAGNPFSPSSSQSQNWSAYQANTVSPLAAKPAMSLPVSRKRSPEDDLTEHPAKRHMPPRLGQLPNASMNPRPNGLAESARLPVPHLTVNTNQQPKQQQQQHSAYSTPNPYTPQSAGPNQNLVALPPLQPGVRAMATVYQPSPASMVQQPTMPATNYPTAPLPNHPQMNYGTPTKRHSPGSLAPFGSSPMTEQFCPGSAVHTPLTHTPISNSPSFYLQQRASPYKPIRHVNRLLYPPPSASLDQYHLAVPVQPTQMHYQPLGRRNDLRTGVVPEFVVYNRSQQQQMYHGGMQGHQAHYPS